MQSSGWVGVRCVFRAERQGVQIYEERVTLWKAHDISTAIELAEAEAAEYADDVDSSYTGLAQGYLLADHPGHGAEVFSLMRESDLAPEDYLDAFFDTGHERQGQLPESGQGGGRV